MAEKLKSVVEPIFGKGITVASGFDLGAKSPLDSRSVVHTIAERDAHVEGNRAYEGMLVYVCEDKVTYQFDGENWKEFGFDAEAFEANVVDNLESASTIQALSANQGRVLKGLVDTLAANTYSKEEVDAIKEALENKDSELSQTLVEVQGKVETLEESITTIQGAIQEEIGKQLEGIQAELSDVKSEVEGLVVELGNKADLSHVSSEVEKLQAAIDGKADADHIHQEFEQIQGSLGTKADKESVYTKEETDGKINERISNLVGSAPETLDTIEELAAALKDNADIVDVLEDSIANKADRDHVHSYNDLTDLPVIPSIEGLASEEFVQEQINAIEIPEYDDEEIRGLIDGKADVDHTHEELETSIETLNGKVGDLEEEVLFDNDMQIVSGLGGISAGDSLEGMTLKEILNKLLFPYVAPSVSASITFSPTGGTYEFGQTVTVSQIKGSVTKKSEKITKVEFLDGSEVVEVITEGVGGSASYTHVFEQPVEVKASMPNTRFRFRVTDATNKTYLANTSGFNFYYPYYYGVIEDGAELNSDLINGLTKQVTGKGNKNYNYTSNNQCMVIAYPKSYGNLSKILDQNSFDVTSTFRKHEVGVVGLDSTEQPYYVYVSGAATVSNFRMTFNH